MNAIKNDVEALVGKELASANEQFPLFNSVHEAYAILKEEAQEATEAGDVITLDLEKFWISVRNNAPMEHLTASLDNIRKNAVGMAIEAIQVAAMCDKFTLSFVSDSLEGGVEQCWNIKNITQVKTIANGKLKF